MGKKIKNALISVFYKDGLDEMVQLLHAQGVHIYSTGGTYDFITQMGIPCTTVESLTSYPSILGGRVKTLHPLVFGGILGRRNLVEDQAQMQEYKIPEIDLVVVDLYPFEKTLASGAPEADIIEKIDIGGISLIRAACKNFQDVLIVPAVQYYREFIDILKKQGAETELTDRKRFAAYGFNVSSHYDTAIFNYFNQEQKINVLKSSLQDCNTLRYGENPHQQGYFYGNIDDLFEKLNGKELSYNNLLDVDAAIALIDDFELNTVAIIKHNNACGLAQRDTLEQAWKDALAGDPVSAFGGVIITNAHITKAVATLMNELFFELLIAPSYDQEALDILKTKKNRILLRRKPCKFPVSISKTVLNGVLIQEKDLKSETTEDLKVVSEQKPTDSQIKDLLFANKIVKHSKSNAIVLAKGNQLISSGVGQTSRVDALEQAIAKAKHFGFDLNGAVMASDAFFPFSDCIEIAQKQGVIAVIQPGGSIKDQDSTDYANKHGMVMIHTGFRHFKH